MNNGIYLCLYHLPCVCRILIPEICVRPVMLHAFWYIDVLMCVIYICMHWTEQQGRLEALCLLWRLSMKTGRWMHRHMVYTDSAYWDSGAVAARQLGNMPVWIKNDWWAYCTAVCDVHIDKVMKLNLLQYLCFICGCRAVQTNSAETPLAQLHM